MAGDLRLLATELAPSRCQLALDAASSLRAGDALHPACAEQASVQRMATLDEVWAAMPSD